MDLTSPCSTECPVARAARVLDGKWTTLIVRQLLGGPQGFTRLQRGIGPISPRLLTARLRLLEGAGLLTRTVHPTTPPTTAYALTVHGWRLKPVIEAMAAFGVACQTEGVRTSASDPVLPPGVTVHRLR